MFTFASILEAGARTDNRASFFVLANCVNISFGTLDLDLLIGRLRRAVFHPFWQVFPCRIERNLNPSASSDGPPFSAWKGA